MNSATEHSLTVPATANSRVLQLLRLAVALCVSGGLLWWAFHDVDVQNLKQVISNADPGWFLAAYCVVLAGSVLHCVRWSILLTVLSRSHSFRTLLSVHFAGLMFNNLLPAQLGLDAARIQFAGKLAGGRTQMLGIVIVDRLMGALAVAALGLTSWLVFFQDGVPRWIIAIPVVVLLGALTSVCVIILLNQATARRIVQRIPVAAVKGKLVEIVDGTRLSGNKALALAAVGLTAALQCVLMAVALGTVSHALHLPVREFVVGAALPLIAVVTMIPISINSLGVREAMFRITMISLGMNESQAMALAVAWLALVILNSLPGVLGFVSLSRRKPVDALSGHSTANLQISPGTPAVQSSATATGTGDNPRQRMLDRIAEILVCPECRQPLVCEETAEGTDRVCRECGTAARERGMQYLVSGFTQEEIEADWLNRVKERAKRRLRNLYPLAIRILSPVYHSDFVHRFLTDFDLDRQLVADLGAGTQDYSDRVMCIDGVGYESVHVVADLEKLPLKSDSLDGVISVAVLEHARDPAAHAAEMMRVLRPGGRLVCYIPFIQGEHASPHDYQRFTTSGLRELFKGFEVQSLRVEAGPTSGLIWILQEWLALTLSFGSARLYRLLLPLTWIISPLKYFDLLLSKHPEATVIASAHAIEACKPLGSEAASQKPSDP